MNLSTAQLPHRYEGILPSDCSDHRPRLAHSKPLSFTVTDGTLTAVIERRAQDLHITTSQLNVGFVTEAVGTPVPFIPLSLHIRYQALLIHPAVATKTLWESKEIQFPSYVSSRPSGDAIHGSLGRLPFFLGPSLF
jgi:hypothetical protein